MSCLTAAPPCPDWCDLHGTGHGWNTGGGHPVKMCLGTVVAAFDADGAPLLVDAERLAEFVDGKVRVYDCAVRIAGQRLDRVAAVRFASHLCELLADTAPRQVVA